MFLFGTSSVHSKSLQLLYTVVDVQLCANDRNHCDIIDLWTFFLILAHFSQHFIMNQCVWTLF